MTSARGAIVPDDKDWTWVLERACPECGFDTREVGPQDVPGLLREMGPSWRTVLAGGDAAQRPNPATWSALEYACHVRDVFRVFDGRVDGMIEEAAPTFPNWDQDRTVIENRYGEQDPSRVADELAEGAAAIADRFCRPRR